MAGLGIRVAGKSGEIRKIVKSAGRWAARPDIIDVIKYFGFAAFQRIPCKTTFAFIQSVLMIAMRMSIRLIGAVTSIINGVIQVC